MIPVNSDLIEFLIILCPASVFANSLDPNQALQNVELDLDPKLFDTDGFPEIIFLKMLILKKIRCKNLKN